MHSTHTTCGPLASIRLPSTSTRCPQHCRRPSRRLQFGSEKSCDNSAGQGTKGRPHFCRSVKSRESTLATAMAQKQDLLIVGPGVLGSYLGKLWVDAGGGVVGQTNTATNHGRLTKLGITPRTNEEAEGSFANVVFSAPPSGSEDLVGSIKKAIELWNGKGSFVYTSSIGVYASPKNGEAITEDSQVKNPTESASVQAEAAVLNAGGNVVRLAGLYHAQRGPHTFFLQKGTVERWGGYLVSMVHYEDAASLVFEVLSRASEFRKKIFIGYDGHPATFEDMMKAVASSPKYTGEVNFTGKPGPDKGKSLDNSKTLELLNWVPKYDGIVNFINNGAEDWYTTCELF